MRTTSNEGGDVIELTIDPRHTRRWRGMEAEVERLHGRVAELEAQLQEWRNGFQGACYACEPVGEMNIALRARVAELEAENEALHKRWDAANETFIKLEAERDRLREDAARYHAIKSMTWTKLQFIREQTRPAARYGALSFDEAVDQHRAALEDKG